ncbi:MAG: hypothetical protein IT377_22410 [Polyangiaceae bacterium]|nr:hypothetical protein [Polyangiaceae bacterium]
MKKHQLDHLLRAAGRIKGAKQLIVIGSQSLHGKHPDLADELVASAEADLIAKDREHRTEWLNAIGQDSPFHAEFGYYADPVEEGTATLPAGWRGRLVNLPPGDTGGVRGLCLDPHDLAISKYVARREKDLAFNHQLARRGVVLRERLMALLAKTPVTRGVRDRMRRDIDADFGPEGGTARAR